MTETPSPTPSEDPTTTTPPTSSPTSSTPTDSPTESEPSPSPTPTQPAEPSCGHSQAEACWYQPTDSAAESVVYPLLVGFALVLFLLAAILMSQMRRP